MGCRERYRSPRWGRPGLGAVTAMRFRRKNRSPPVLSHEFIIQNHADAAYILVMVAFLGAIVESIGKVRGPVVAERSSA